MYYANRTYGGKNMEYVSRINLKTDTDDREGLIEMSLNSDAQMLPIGWSCVYSDNVPKMISYNDYLEAVKVWSKQNGKRINTVLSIFSEAKENDLFWTRDLEGYYWICRVTGPAYGECISVFDIGAALPVEAYKYGLEVPGQIKASFNKPFGGIAERIKSKTVIEYSKFVYNKMSNSNTYEIDMNNCGDIIDNLPDYDLEELVISYIQIRDNLYVLSNSIAKNSTTIAIECEFRSRSLDAPRKAVVQVKGGERELDAEDYYGFIDEGYDVYLYAKSILNADIVDGIIVITRDELKSFYDKYKSVLPNNIVQWENLFI